MFVVSDKKVIMKGESYLSFPDIIKSIHSPQKYFIVFREGDSHHPVWSNLILMESQDEGKTWKVIHKFPLGLRKSRLVWNCPRLYYNPFDFSLNIVCDAKSTTRESNATFKIFNIKSKDDGKTFSINLTEMPGMVPDQIVYFKGKLYCANHKIKEDGHGLAQLISWSRNNGNTWYDTNLLSDHLLCRFCEASVVNVRDEFLCAYLRDNSGHVRHMYQTTSQDGINWSTPEALKVYGQRPSSILYDRDTVLTAFRNTNEVSISVMCHNLTEDTINVSQIDFEKQENLYNFGYTGIARISADKFYVVYYIQNEEAMPFIKLSTIEKSKKKIRFTKAKASHLSFTDRLCGL
jgi:hypothetical protein